MWSVFILQNTPTRKTTEPIAEDAEFALQNQDKIYNAIRITQQFLQSIKLDEYIKNTKSVIPLYFVIYHLFHSPNPDEVITKEGSKSRQNLKRWLLLVYLNSIYQSGRRVGWRANTTGIKRTLSCLSQYKGTIFPCEQLLDVYRGHNLRFSETIDINNLQSLNIDFTFFLLNAHKKYIRSNDIDHIHPKSKLGGFDYDKINHLANFELLGVEDNRGDKSDLSLREWIESLDSSKDSWIKENYIPTDSSTWEIENFEQFLIARTALINQALNQMIPQKLDKIPTPSSATTELPPQPSSSNTDPRWENKLRLVNLSGYGDLFLELHRAAINVKMWITTRERAIQYHHTLSGTRILMTLYPDSAGIWVILRLKHYPEFYKNSGQFIASVKDGGQYISKSELPGFIEKIKGLKSI